MSILLAYPNFIIKRVLQLLSSLEHAQTSQFPCLSGIPNTSGLQYAENKACDIQLPFILHWSPHTSFRYDFLKGEVIHKTERAELGTSRWPRLNSTETHVCESSQKPMMTLHFTSWWRPQIPTTPWHSICIKQHTRVTNEGPLTRQQPTETDRNVKPIVASAGNKFIPNQKERGGQIPAGDNIPQILQALPLRPLQILSGAVEVTQTPYAVSN